MAWVAIGALVVHIAVKLPIIREALAGPTSTRTTTVRRRRRSPAAACVRTAWLASAVAVLLTAGGTVPWLRKVSVFGVRSGDGPQDIPINKSRPRRRGDGHARPTRRTASTSCTATSRCR